MAKDEMNFSTKRQILPPTYLLLGILFMILLHYLFPSMEMVPKPWILLGVVPVTLGIWINLQAARIFESAQTTINSFGKPTQLVSSGVFRFSRNPMYLGMVLLLLGVAILLGSFTPFFVIPVFIILINQVFINFEEQMMEKQFGRAWIEYTFRVRRWI